MQNQAGDTFVTPEVTLVTSYPSYSSYSWSYKCNSSLVLHKILLYYIQWKTIAGAQRKNHYF